jgi:hypothetical protein
MSISACVHLEPQERLDCVTQHTDSKPEGYPVLHIGSVAIFATVHQLATIRAVINIWLAADDDAKAEAKAEAPAAVC